MNCPICDTPLDIVEEDAKPNWGVIRIVRGCPHRHYRRERSYGAMTVFVGPWKYNESQSPQAAIRWYRFWWRVGAPVRWLRAKWRGVAPSR